MTQDDIELAIREIKRSAKPLAIDCAFEVTEYKGDFALVVSIPLAVGHETFLDVRSWDAADAFAKGLQMVHRSKWVGR